MTLPTIPPRRRRLAALTAVSGLFALLPAIAAGGPAGAAPVEDCAVPFPVAEVEAGDEVTGATVSRGVDPDGFTGTVLGVLADGISPGVDMVIADLDSPAIDDAGGIWQGMSGSPVYAQDGRLIGAVAYGLAYGASPIAGITPFENMDDYLPSAAPRVRLTPQLAREVAEHTDVSPRAASTLTQLQVPLGVSGVSPRVLSKATRLGADRPWLSSGTTLMGRASARAATVDDVDAGGNLAASLAYGDVALAGVGTATSVCEGHVVGFGHPLAFGGDEQTLGLHPAEAVYVQPDPLDVPFKVANLGDPVGTITDDHLTGITGEFGDVPEVITVQNEVTFGSRHRLGTSYVSVPWALAEVAFYQNLGNHATVVDEQAAGAETQTWTIEGFDSDGSPFTFTYSNLFASESDVSYAGAWALPDLLAEVTSIDGVRVTSVLNEVVVQPNPQFLEIGKLQQFRNRKLVTVTERRPAIVRAGQVLKVRVNLTGGSKPRWKNLEFQVPRRARGWEGALIAMGGSGDEGEEEFRTARRADDPSELDQLFASLRRQPRADQVRGGFYLEGDGYLERYQTKEPLGIPVTGARYATVVVR